jgi:hypothetical protein
MSAARSGALWRSCIRIAQLAIFAFVPRRSSVARAETGRIAVRAFYACGLWPWIAFREGLARGGEPAKAAHLIKKIVSQ